MAVLDADWKLILAYDDDAGTTNGDGENEDDESDRRTDAPTATRCVCRRFYLHEERDVLNLFDRGVNGTDKGNRILSYFEPGQRDSETNLHIPLRSSVQSSSTTHLLRNSTLSVFSLPRIALE